jgi:hypothetical protein
MMIKWQIIGQRLAHNKKNDNNCQL